MTIGLSALGQGPIAEIASHSTLSPKVDDHRFCIGAFGAFKSARVVAKLVGRLNGREQHREATGRAAALADWRFTRHDVARMWHSNSPS